MHAVFSSVLAVDCDFINFNNGNFNLHNCSGNLTHLDSWEVFEFGQFYSRTGNETHYISNPNVTGYQDLCSETRLYDVDEDTLLQVFNTNNYS